jgi:uncharacterized protein YjcR
MLNMSDINDIRDLYSRGYKIGEIARKTGFDPKTIRKYLDKEDFSEEAPSMTTKASILDPYKSLIADWLKEDQKHWNKQRHTAK